MLAQLAHRDLVAEVWVPSLSDRELRERLWRRAHLVRLKTSARNRMFGLLTQWGIRANLKALRQPGSLRRLSERGVPAVWIQSLRVLLGVADDLERLLAAIETELLTLARTDDRAQLLLTIPGIGELLGLTIAAEIGEVACFANARKLIGYAGLAPTIEQSGQSSWNGRISKAGSPTLRWAAIEAAQLAWRPSNPWHRLYIQTSRRHGKTNPAKAAIARKVLIACWHVLRCSNHSNPTQQPRPRSAPASSPTLWPPDGPRAT